MPEKIWTLEEIEDDIMTNSSTRVCLMDSKSKKLVAWNSNKTPLNQRWDDVKARLNSKATPDGMFQIHAKHHGHNVEPIVYYYQKGNPAASQALTNPNLSDDYINNLNPEPLFKFDQNHTVTNADHLTLHKEFFEVKTENEYLKKRIEELEENIDQLNVIIDEKEDDDENGFLSDSKNWLSDIAAQAFPLIQEAITLRKQKMGLEAMRLDPSLIPSNTKQHENEHFENDYNNREFVPEDYSNYSQNQNQGENEDF
jgi:hypothetical protein